MKKTNTIKSKQDNVKHIYCIDFENSSESGSYYRTFTSILSTKCVKNFLKKKNINYFDNSLKFSKIGEIRNGKFKFSMILDDAYFKFKKRIGDIK